jgi:hypothetical protein
MTKTAGMRTGSSFVFWRLSLCQSAPRVAIRVSGCVATSGLLCGDVKESRNGNPTRDLQMATDRTRIEFIDHLFISSIWQPEHTCRACNNLSASEGCNTARPPVRG